MRRPALVLLGFLMSFGVTAAKAQTPGAANKPATSVPKSSVAPKPIHLPLFFEANRGQADSRVQFMARGKGYTLLLTPTETVLAESKTQVSARSGAFAPFENPLIATKTSRGSVIRMQLVGANSAPAMTGLEELPGKVNYLIGNDPSKWQTQVALYSQARTEQVYPGVNLLFHGDERELEYDFVVAPGADPSKIAFRIRGAARTEIDAHGDLVLHTADSEFRMHKPVIYQTIASERRPIEGNFVKKGKNEVAFRLGAYDHSQQLVIDPAIGFSSFLGGAGEDVSGGFAIDDSTPGSPKLYLSGFTLDSASFAEPKTIIGSGTTSTLPVVAEVGFVAKIDPTASGAASLVYLTFVGGSVPSLSTQKGCLSGFVWLALDKSQGAGNIVPVLGGETSCGNFPSATVLNPVTDPSGTSNGLATMAVRMMPSGAAIDKAASLGGNNNLGGGFIAVGTGGNVILSGETQATNLPTKNAYVNTFDNGATPLPYDDCFVTVLNRADLSISYLTYLNVGGGSTSGDGAGCGAFEDASGNILAGGNTPSPTAFNLGPGGTSLANGFQTTFQGTRDTFGMKLNPSLVGVNQLLYASYFGGGGDTRAANGSFDLGNGVVAIVGSTTSNSANGDIPLKNAFQMKNNATGGGMVGFLVLVNTMQTGAASLQCGTYFGGTGGGDIVGAVTYDAGDPTDYRIILGGRTNSATDFPTTTNPNPIQPYVGAVVGGMQSPDGFLSMLRVPTPSQTAFNATLVFSTYIGGSNPPAQLTGASPTLLEDDRINAVAVDANHTVYAVGESNAPGGFFANTNPTTTVNGFQTTCASCSAMVPEDDVVVFSIGTGANATLQSIAVTPTTASIPVGQTQQFSAVGNYNDGTEKDITSLVTWTTVPTGFATMSTTSPGLATGTALGSTAVTPALGTATVLNTGALTVTAAAGADLAITKTGPSSIALGADLPYVITVTNNGPGAAAGVVMTDPVPGNLQPLMVVASETCTHVVNIDTGATTLSCAIGALANGASTQISYHVTPTAAGSLTNTATVAGSSTDPNMGNNSASVTTTVGAAAATHFSVTAPGTATAGTAFSITVTALDASNAVVTGYTGTVHFTGSDTQAVLPANSTLTNGVGTFSVTLKTAGAQTIAATDTVTATITGSSGTITVGAATLVTLQVKTAGTGFGTVTDNLSKISCSQEGGVNPAGSCSAQYPSGTQVTLTATTPGTFGGFVGAPTACTGTGNTCQFTITAAETVTGTFTPGPGMFALTVVAGTPHTGGGTITSAPTGINCTLTGTTTSGTCMQNFPAGTLVTLTSAPGPGSGFFGWSGTAPTCLASSSVSCLLNMSAATTATVEFTSGGGTVNVTVTGAGNVTDTANAGEINCTNTAGGTQTGTCSGGYTLGAGVTLTETPAAGATFSGWTGASCTNPTAATCSFQVINTTPIAVAATFAASGGAATHFSVTAPTTATAGTMFNLTVTALTAANTTATGYTGTVHFTSSDSKAVLPANSALANGTGTLQAVLNTAGAQTITATDTVTASITGVSGTITVAGVGPAPMLNISKTHVGNFTQGQQGAQYSLTVMNSGAGPTSGNAVSTTVQSTGSIYATGDGSTAPTIITLPSGATSIVFNSVTGSITTGCASTEGCIVLNNGTGNNANDPDGVGAAPATSSNTGTSSISGMVAPGAGYLVGLFVPAGGPTGTAPTALDFTSSGLGTSFTSLSPQLDQVFFIGDGLTGDGTGTQQTFNIPTGAGQLWLGISDAGFYNGAPGAYGDNLGTYTVGLSVNAPGSSAVTVTETAPSGLTLVSMAGTGWTCGGANPANVCTRSDVLAGGASYPVITVSVNVAADATSPQVNMAGVTGGGSAPANASDSTVIESAGVTQPLTVVTAGTGTGMVTGNGINCVSGSANACMASLPAGTQVVLTQAGTNGSTFAGWNGAPTMCTVAGATCSFTMPASAEAVTATFTAAAATLKSIAVTPANPTEPINSSVQFTATGTYSDNSTKDITATVTWASSNTEAATINAAGLVTVGGTAGLTTTISATLNEVTGSTLLTVSSSPISISVTPPAGGTFPPVPPGGTLAIGIVLTSTPGFSGTVTFGCTTSSPTITCAPDPAKVTLTPTGPTDVAIVLNTFCKGTTTAQFVPTPGGFGGGITLLLLGLTLGGVLWMWRRSPRWAVSFAILVLMAIGGASCASPPKGPNGATQPGNYTVTFSATVNGVTTSTAPIPFTVE
ncbi:MAG: Ig-like domain-containing protein [Candidatus Acidiferrales bacterium]